MKTARSLMRVPAITSKATEPPIMEPGEKAIDQEMAGRSVSSLCREVPDGEGNKEQEGMAHGNDAADDAPLTKGLHHPYKGQENFHNTANQSDPYSVMPKRANTPHDFSSKKASFWNNGRLE